MISSRTMRNGTGRSLKSDRGRRAARRLLLAGAAVGVPVLAAALLRRRVEPPSPPRWGRTHRFTGRSGQEIVFQELGSGPPVVLLHAFGPGYGVGQWRDAAEILAARHTVYVPDFPGWGRTRAASGAHHPDRYLGLIEDFLGGVVRERAVLVAAGLAAAYAIHAAVDHPGRVRALALVSPLGLTAAAAHPFLGTLLGLPLVGAPVLDLLTSRTALEQHLRREVYAAPERVDAGLLEQYHRASHTGPARAAFAAYLRGGLALDVAEELPRLHVPLWLAWGRQGKNPPVATADLWLHELSGNQPGAELDVLEGAGDLPHAETPALFCRALERFLEQVPG